MNERRATTAPSASLIRPWPAARTLAGVGRTKTEIVARPGEMPEPEGMPLPAGQPCDGPRPLCSMARMSCSDTALLSLTRMRGAGLKAWP